MSGIIDLAVGLILIFLVFSLAVSGINEAITRALALRARTLWRELSRLMDGAPGAIDKDQRPRRDVTPSAASRLVDQLYATPFIKQLERRTATSRSRLASIPSPSAARSVLHVLNPAGGTAIVPEELTKAIAALPASELKTHLEALAAEMGGDLVQLRKGIEDWFNARMEHLSAIYKRNAKWILAVMAVAIVVFFNVDAVNAAQRLYRDANLRGALAESAATVVADCQTQTDPLKCAGEKVDRSDLNLPLPVGWGDGSSDDVPLRTLGWLVSVIAISQGAPFWFDLLRKATSFRKSDTSAAGG